MGNEVTEGESYDVSIRTPREGGDCKAQEWQVTPGVSIRTPREGGDRVSLEVFCP